jgi:hypothetical protein
MSDALSRKEAELLAKLKASEAKLQRERHKSKVGFGGRQTAAVVGKLRGLSCGCCVS